MSTPYIVDERGYLASVVLRLRSKIEVNVNTTLVNGQHCWEYQGAKQGDYGVLKVRDKNQLVHRLAYCHLGEEEKIIPYDKPVILHACDNTICCNPAHLSPGTVADNVADRHSKGRTATGCRILSKPLIVEILLNKDGLTARQQGAKYGVSHYTIYKLRKDNAKRS